MKRALKRIFGVLIVLAILAAGWVVIDYRAFLRAPLPVGDDGMELVVEPGMSLRTIANQLGQRGVLHTPSYLVWLGRLEEKSHRIQAGEYHIALGTTPRALLDMMVAGRVRLHGFTIVEGWTFAQLREALRQHSALSHTLTNVDDDGVMERLGHPGEHPEGRFLPETYHFPRGTTDLEFLRRAYDALAQRLASEWEQRVDDLPLESPYDALILASIIEKETAVESERTRIASVFVRRLQRGMRLQTDPTVIYGMGDIYDGNIRRSDLRRDTPYNTYTRSGLPPTPIALPSAESIHAALHPAEDDALYFVSRGDGTHVFSATLTEHNRAVRKYQLGGRARPSSSETQAEERP